MKNLVFTDIDGILNHFHKGYTIDNACVEALSMLCKQLDAQIVITAPMKNKWSLNRENCTPQIIDLLTTLDEYNIEVHGVTQDLGDKTKEIEEYISKNKIKKENYIVLESNTNANNRYIGPNLYIIKFKQGLNTKNIKHIIKKHIKMR